MCVGDKAWIDTANEAAVTQPPCPSASTALAFDYCSRFVLRFRSASSPPFLPRSMHPVTRRHRRTGTRPRTLRAPATATATARLGLVQAHPCLCGASCAHSRCCLRQLRPRLASSDITCRRRLQPRPFLCGIERLHQRIALPSPDGDVARCIMMRVPLQRVDHCSQATMVRDRFSTPRSGDKISVAAAVSRNESGLGTGGSGALTVMVPP